MSDAFSARAWQRWQPNDLGAPQPPEPELLLEIWTNGTIAPDCASVTGCFTDEHRRVLGRVSVTRGRHGVLLEERPLTTKSITDLDEDVVAQFLVEQIPKIALKRS